MKHSGGTAIRRHSRTYSAAQNDQGMPLQELREDNQIKTEMNKSKFRIKLQDKDLPSNIVEMIGLIFTQQPRVFLHQ